MRKTTPTASPSSKTEVGFWLRATELRSLPDGRFQIVIELTPRTQQEVLGARESEVVPHAG